jgi:arylsulfatase
MLPLRLCLLVFLALASLARAADPQRPNILVILADDLGFSDLSSYGGEIPTPNLDELAKSGVRFSHFYNTARCCPTRAALLTGMYPHQAGVGHMVDAYAQAARAKLASPAYTDHLSKNTPTIAEILGAAGYRTGMSGKWHVGYRPDELPFARGFQRSLVQIDGAMNYWGYGIQHNSPPGEKAEPPMARDGQPWSPPREGFFSTDAYADFAMEFIGDASPSREPFFFYLAFNAPHWPLHAPAEDIAPHRARYEAGYDVIRAERLARLKKLGLISSDAVLSPRLPRLPSWEEATPEQRASWTEKMAIYAAQISRMDAAIGRVISRLRETGALDNTLILFMSDNGGAAEDPKRSLPGAVLGSRDSYAGYDLPGAHVSSAPFRMTKVFVHEGGIASPLIARWPAQIKPGTTTHQVGHVIDIAATVLAAASVPFPQKIGERAITPTEGVSLLPAMRGEQIQRPQPLFWEHQGHRAVREGNWKLVSRYPENQWELYDLSSDPTELKDLSSAQPGKMEEMSAKYEAWAERCQVRPWALTKTPEKK